jgi:PAS domain S-box-containing protein
MLTKRTILTKLVAEKGIDYMNKAAAKPNEGLHILEKVQVNPVAETHSLVKSEYRNLLEHIPVITYVASLESRVKLLYVSPQISQLGFPVAEWLDNPQGLLKHVHPDDLALTIEAYTHTYHHHVPLRCEYRLSNRDGYSRWFLDQAIVVPNETGENLFLQGVLVDITQYKAIGQELSYYPPASD